MSRGGLSQDGTPLGHSEHSEQKSSAVLESDAKPTVMAMNISYKWLFQWDNKHSINIYK